MNHFAPIVAALVTLLMTAIILRSQFSNKVQDIPNERSLHATPIPRAGGVALIAGILSGWALMFDALEWWLVVPMLGLFIVSLFDDLRGLPVRMRLVAHLVAATILIGGLGLLAQQGLVVALTVLLFTVWMTNLYNFMDGSDGLAGGMALFGFGSYALAAGLSGNVGLAGVTACIAASSLAFLVFNFHPARIFLGDAGSIPLGFMAAALGLLGWQQGSWPLWFPLLVFSPFIVDATLTLCKRLCRAEKIWQPHRTHYYQRLVQMGLGHLDTAICEYVLMLSVGCSAIWLIYKPMVFQSIGLILWCGIYVIVALCIDKSWRQYKLSR